MFLTAKHLEGCSDKTIRHYRCNIQKMLETINVPFVKISTEMLRKYLVEYQSINNCGKVTIDNIHRSLSTFFFIEQVQKILGHEQIDTTLRYAMVNQNNVKLSHRKYIS